MSSSVEHNKIDGDVSIGRNVAIGGDVIAQGDGHVKGDFRVDGWLIAKNIKTEALDSLYKELGEAIDAAKGVFDNYNKLPPVMCISTDGDTSIAPGEVVSIRCSVLKGVVDITTDHQWKWKIERYTGNTQDDTAWDTDHSNFAGEVDISYSDLGSLAYSHTSTKFTITATADTQSVSSILEI